MCSRIAKNMSLATAATQVEQSRFVEGTHIQTCHPRPA